MANLSDAKHTEGDIILEAIKRHIKLSLEAEFDRRLKEVFDDINSKKNEIVAGVLIDIVKTIDIERAGNRITFMIQEIKKP